MSEQKAEQTSGEPGSLNAGPASPHSPDAHSEPVTATAQDPMRVESPDLAPGQGAADEMSKVDASKVDVPKVEIHKADASSADAAKVDAPKADSTKADSTKADAAKADAPEAGTTRVPGQVIMLSGDHAWDRSDAGPEAKSGASQGMFGKRRLSALAAVAVLAMVTGALGGALATAGFSRFMADDSRTADRSALQEQVARLDADMTALKASVEHTSKLGISQFNKTSDRLDKVEKAQAEPAAKLARLSEAVDKLRAPVAATPVAAASPVAAAKDVTGSIAPAATAPATVAKPEPARLPTLENWVLRDVANGGALIEGRQGIFEVYAGDPVPGIGRVDAIRRQDGRWVVVTSRGLIVAR